MKFYFLIFYNTEIGNTELDVDYNNFEQNLSRICQSLIRCYKISVLHFSSLLHYCDLNEDAMLDLEGSAVKMELIADEDSMFKSYDFIVEDLVAELNEDSMAKITVNGTIDLEARGDSSFFYKGNAKMIRQRLRGDSKVKVWNR